MMVFSFIVGYFFSMTLLVNSPSNVTTNLNKIYMSFLMSTLMGAFDVAMMCNDNSCSNTSYIILISLIIISIMLVVSIKQQYGIGQEQFILSMIEHHAMALTMAKKAKPKLTDKKVKAIADDILVSQCRQIDEMKRLLD
jgi:hypothetical protein